jgi:uncharacterized protein
MSAEPHDAPRAFHVLAKPTGATCNLDCAYCFFLSKELLYPGSRFRMAEELLETYIRQLLEAHAALDEVTVAWQGGEPTLMGLDFFRRSIELQRQIARPGQRVVNTIQTNGTLLDDAWAAFFAEHGFLVGLSIDGPRELHDVYRVDKGGHGSFDQVMRGLRVLQRHGVELNTLTTLHRGNADHPLEVYRFLRDECGSRFHQYIPIVERMTGGQPIALEEPTRPGQGSGRRSWREQPVYTQAGEEASARSVLPEQYGQFLIAIFEEWVRRDVGTVFVQPFDVALASWAGAPHGLCIHSETCGSALALEHNGDLYSCDHFVEPAYRLGNITKQHMIELVASPQQRAFGLHKRDSLPGYCRRCEVRFACHGGCPKDRFIATPDGEPGLNYLCVGYQRFFRHVDEPMRFMARQLQQGGAPALIMHHYAERDEQLRRAVAAAGRNDPCPCGSGRKTKRCHGAAAAR